MPLLHDRIMAAQDTPGFKRSTPRTINRQMGSHVGGNMHLGSIQPLLQDDIVIKADNVAQYVFDRGIEKELRKSTKWFMKRIPMIAPPYSQFSIEMKTPHCVIERNLPPNRWHIEYIHHVHFEVTDFYAAHKEPRLAQLAGINTYPRFKEVLTALADFSDIEKFKGRLLAIPAFLRGLLVTTILNHYLSASESELESTTMSVDTELGLWATSHKKETFETLSSEAQLIPKGIAELEVQFEECFQAWQSYLRIDDKAHGAVNCSNVRWRFDAAHSFSSSDNGQINIFDTYHYFYVTNEGQIVIGEHVDWPVVSSVLYDIPVGWSIADFNNQATNYLLVALVTLSFLYLHNPKKGHIRVNERIPRKGEVNSFKKKSGGTELHRYHVLELDMVKRMLEQNRHRRGTGSKLSFCAVRRYYSFYSPDKPLFGHTVGWVEHEPHTRGDPKKGIVEKDYKVTGDLEKAKAISEGAIDVHVV